MDRVLVSWVGHADLDSVGQAESEGPLIRSLKAQRYAAIYLLHTQPLRQLKALLAEVESYGVSPELCKAKLQSPVHFGDIYRALNGLLEKVSNAHPGAAMCIQISSGTPAMTAVSILVGKTKFPCRFIQSSKEAGVNEVDLPFDIAAEFLPTLAERSDQEVNSLMAAAAPVTAEFDQIITQNHHMNTLKHRAVLMAKRDVPVLITGETGTGKELFAKAIHNSSQRAGKPMLVLNCGAIPEELIDATLFGHTKGAFTGAAEAKKGYFEQADGGTLFLDEFGELPMASQVRLLRVLQDGTFTPLGSTKEKVVNVRIIAATNKNLVESIGAGTFREDLFYRVAIGVVNLPPLRDRPGDLSLLADSLMEQINQESCNQPGYQYKKLSPGAKKVILGYGWPGNVRELHATLLRASLWHEGSSLSAEDITAALLPGNHESDNILNKPIRQGVDINEILQKVSVHYIERALETAQGSKTKAASLLGLKNYQTLNNWIEKYGVKAGE